MIETRWVKWVVVVALLSVATFFATNSKRRRVGYVVAVLFAVPAVYVLLRVHPRDTPSLERGSILGDVDAFLVEVPDLSRRFQEWAKPKGIAWPIDPTRFQKWVWDHREDIGERWQVMLPLVSAAYGEVIRGAHPGAVWSKRGGDAVIQIPGRPWSRKAVAVEIHDIVFSDT